MPWTCPTQPHATLLGLFLLLAPPITAQQPPPWTQPNPNYNSPMATALIVMIIVFFTIGFLSVYLRHFLACLGFYPRGGGPRRGGGNTREPPRGLDPTIVNTFPTFLYSDVKIHRVGKTSTPLECAICLSEFADHEILRLLPKCNHVFHPHCIDPWLTSHVTCPVCRANLEKIQPHTNTNINNNHTPFDHLTSEDDDEAAPQPSDQTLHQDEVIVRLEASPETKSPSPTAQEIIMKGLSLSESGRIIRLPRSHSTGHSLVGDSDRFTLRLPDEVRNKLVNDNNYRNCFTRLPDAIVSPRSGYRVPNVGCSGIPVKTDRWRFSMSPPFISRPNSPKLEVVNSSSSSNNNVSNIMSGGLLRSPKNLFRSIRSPNKSSLQRIVSCSDIGEQSSDRLWANRDIQEL